MLVNSGRDHVAESIGGRNVGFVRAASANITYSATQAADSGAAFSASTGTPGTPGTGSGLVGRIVVSGPQAAAATVYGVIRDNTATAVNIDFWHDPTNPATVGTTPTGGAGNHGFVIMPASSPCFWMGISIATLAPAAGHAFLTNDGTTISEIFGASQTGLSRQIAAYAHTSGTATYTIQKTFTQGGSDPGSSAVAKVGVFQHGVTASPTTTTTGVLLFNTNLASTATLSAVGDNVQITDTVTIS